MKGGAGTGVGTGTGTGTGAGAGGEFWLGLGYPLADECGLAGYFLFSFFQPNLFSLASNQGDFNFKLADENHASFVALGVKFH